MHSYDAHEDPEELGLSNQSPNQTFESVFHSYISRRSLLQGAVASLVLAYATPLRPSQATAAAGGFTPLSHSTEDQLLVPPGYDYSVVIRWGDPVLADTTAFDPTSQTPAKQARQFGYNADFIGFLPLPAGSQNGERGLLVVNHEYVNPELMFAEWDGKPEGKTRKIVDIELAAHGLAVIEVQRDAKGAWTCVPNSPYNRRLTAESPMTISGPAAGHPWLKTSYDSTGMLVRGTLNNCAGGITPWGTVLSAEENFNVYFGGALDSVPDETFAPCTSAMVWPIATAGEDTMTVSTSAKSPTRPCALGGSSRSICTTRSR